MRTTRDSDGHSVLRAILANRTPLIYVHLACKSCRCCRCRIFDLEPPVGVNRLLGVLTLLSLGASKPRPPYGSPYASCCVCARGVLNLEDPLLVLGVGLNVLCCLVDCGLLALSLDRRGPNTRGYPADTGRLRAPGGGCTFCWVTIDLVIYTIFICRIVRMQFRLQV